MESDPEHRKPNKWLDFKRICIYPLTRNIRQMEYTEAKIRHRLESIKQRSEKLNYLRRCRADIFLYIGSGSDTQNNRLFHFIEREIEYWDTYIEPETIAVSEQDKPDKRETTTNQQILILKYLGIEFQKLDIGVKKRGVLFGYLLNRNSTNTENVIRNLEKPPEKDLKRVLEIFQECDFRDHSIQVENDLKTLQEKKTKSNQEKK
jgi:hypothetical protein